MKNDVESILISEEEIKEIVADLGKKITNDYKKSDKKLLLLCILKGSVIFSADLMRSIDLPVEIDFMRVSSYGRGTTTSGSVNIVLDIHRNDLETTDILVVEDIIDSGVTLSYLCEYLKLKGANSVKTVTMLDKPERRKVDFNPDYVGKVIPDAFVIGYGLDYDEKYRSLPYIGILKPEIYSE